MKKQKIYIISMKIEIDSFLVKVTTTATTSECQNCMSHRIRKYMDIYHHTNHTMDVCKIQYILTFCHSYFIICRPPPSNPLPTVVHTDQRFTARFATQILQQFGQLRLHLPESRFAVLGNVPLDESCRVGRDHVFGRDLGKLERVPSEVVRVVQ